jgi:putative heme utilization carrier protein HutX
MEMSIDAKDSLAANQAEPLLRALAQWGPTTTVVVHGGCVFEFKGPFPPGEVGEGYYNLTGAIPGFHGHIRLDVIETIGFQEKQHRGQDSYAFVFKDAQGAALFKVFLGRDAMGAVYPDQIEKFHILRDSLSINIV